MGRDFLVKVFYGFFVDGKEAAAIQKKYNNEGEEDGWFMFLEEVEQQKGPVEVCVLAEGVEDNGVRDYRLALASRESSKRMYVNEDNEIHKIKDLTSTKTEWIGVLKRFCSEHGITFFDPEWWLCTEGE
jgi:hypothetical protein